MPLTGASIFDYCERSSAAFWAEPLNAITNAGFIVAALAGIPGGNIVEVVAGGDGGADDEKQHLSQRMGDPPSLARVLNLRKMIQKATNPQFRAEIVHFEGSRIRKPDGITQHAIVK